MKAKKLKPTMWPRPMDPPVEPGESAQPNGRTNGKRRRRKSVRPSGQLKGKQKPRRRNGQRSITDPDEMMPVAPNRFVMGSDGAAAIGELDRKCNDLMQNYLRKIEDFRFTPYEQMSLEEKRAERRRCLKANGRIMP